MYNPSTKPETLDIDRERYAYWVGKGAQPSDTVRTVVKRHKAEPVATAVAEQPAS
jgi:small subunit ribosomal protein S16